MHHWVKRCISQNVFLHFLLLLPTCRHAIQRQQLLLLILLPSSLVQSYSYSTQYYNSKGRIKEALAPTLKSLVPQRSLARRSVPLVVDCTFIGTHVAHCYPSTSKYSIWRVQCLEIKRISFLGRFYVKLILVNL